MRTTALIAFISFILLSCTKQNKSSSYAEKIDMTDGLKNQVIMNLSTIASDIDYIHLETDNECPIGNISSTKLKDSLLLITDEFDRLFVFNRKGKCILKLDKKRKSTRRIFKYYEV